MTDPENPFLSPRFKAKDLAKAIADGGVAYPTAAARVANYAKADQLEIRGTAGSGAVNSAKLYSLADMCVAVMLSNFQDCGVADQELLKLASISLYGWTSVPHDLTHPVMQAALDTFAGDPWMLQIDFYRNDDADFRETNRAFYRVGDAPIWSNKRFETEPEWEIVGTIMINTASLARLERYLRVDPKAN